VNLRPGRQPHFRTPEADIDLVVARHDFSDIQQHIASPAVASREPRMRKHRNLACAHVHIEIPPREQALDRAGTNVHAQVRCFDAVHFGLSVPVIDFELLERLAVQADCGRGPLAAPEEPTFRQLDLERQAAAIALDLDLWSRFAA
jgi:hypothetical protein